MCDRIVDIDRLDSWDSRVSAVCLLLLNVLRTDLLAVLSTVEFLGSTLIPCDVVLGLLLPCAPVRVTMLLWATWPVVIRTRSGLGVNPLDDSPL